MLLGRCTTNFNKDFNFFFKFLLKKDTKCADRGKMNRDIFRSVTADFFVVLFYCLKWIIQFRKVENLWCELVKNELLDV